METPYLLFIGNETEETNAKTASGIAYWRPDDCVGQLRLTEATADLGLMDMSLQEGKSIGAKTLLIGVANEGGYISDEWMGALCQALEMGYNLASGLHVRLHDIPELRHLAEEKGVELYDLRTPSANIPVGTGKPRAGKRLLSVGSDCAIGKMFTVLSLEKEMKLRGMNADFRATGQTGIFIAGSGIPIDAVVSDFISGAAESMAPANAPDHWDLIEGQGSLLHPSYAGVTLGLIHGSQPDYMVLSHLEGQKAILGHEDYLLPPLPEIMEMYEKAARLTNKGAKVVGLSLVTKGMEETDAFKSIRKYEDKLGIPCFDPVRTGVSNMVDVLEAL